MKRYSVVILVVLFLSIPLFSAISSAADQSVFYGILVSFKGNTLTVMDQKGTTERFDVNKNTLVSSREGTARLEKLLPGTRLSVTAKGDRAVMITIKEVPK
ncbi:hypothetical protein KI809_15050 [Geobacter pelophilus]|uniref:DUF5666 domain-containing protein n=1 Tax=Geoanaerobacter pelophilus TaxID=60036 RepID=A0AAW4L712_9BACT|nr:hypothetical protein [Geoanaerobacter pelophilus]MBT0665625.1 hypothetical protein [Geoanaerobacter pelophilus]